jgi:hypothetical protein
LFAGANGTFGKISKLDVRRQVTNGTFINRFQAPRSLIVPKSQFPHHLTATLWEYIMPLDRGERYEDPLDAALDGLGQVVGGGSQLSDDCGIEFVDIEIALANLDETLDIVKSTLEKQGAPRGSQLRFTEKKKDRVIEFGLCECVAIFLDGTGLPDEVYESNDINELADQLYALLQKKNLGEIRGSWVGPAETAVFISGLDAEQVYAGIEFVLRAYPLCQNARVVLRHGKSSLKPREIRLPMKSPKKR